VTKKKTNRGNRHSTRKLKKTHTAKQTNKNKKTKYEDKKNGVQGRGANSKNGEAARRHPGVRKRS